MRAGCPVVVAQWYSTGSSSQEPRVWVLPTADFTPSFPSSSLQLLTEQEKALKERIRDLEAANAENKMDPTHLAKLEKQVQQFQKGELDYSRGSCSQTIPIGQLFFPLVM